MKATFTPLPGVDRREVLGADDVTDAELEALGMVTVTVADHDARARVVRITDAGRDALARAAAVLAACDEAWAAQVGPERWRVFREVLEEVALD